MDNGGTAMMQRIPEFLSTFRQERLSSLRPPQEFFDVQRVSRPADLTVATQRITYNTRHFSGNYILVVGMLALYSLLTNPLLLIAIGFLVGGFYGINRFIPEPVQFGSTVITQKTLYTGLFCIGLPLLFIASPLSAVFWLVGASSILILGHAALLEPGVESEYGSVQTV